MRVPTKPGEEPGLFDEWAYLGKRTRNRRPDGAEPFLHPVRFLRWEWRANRPDLIGGLVFLAVTAVAAVLAFADVWRPREILSSGDADAAVIGAAFMCAWSVVVGVAGRFQRARSAQTAVWIASWISCIVLLATQLARPGIDWFLPAVVLVLCVGPLFGGLILEVVVIPVIATLIGGVRGLARGEAGAGWRVGLALVLLLGATGYFGHLGSIDNTGERGQRTLIDLASRLFLPVPGYTVTDATRHAVTNVLFLLAVAAAIACTATYRRAARRAARA